MTYAVPVPGYTVGDLDWLRAELGVAHIELDPWGSILVTPATDDHERVIAVLHGQALAGLSIPLECVLSPGLPWKIPGGSGYTNIPDLSVVVPGWRRAGELDIEPPPALVVEVGSPSTRGVDRGRKLSDYRLGRAGVYLLVDPPDVTGGDALFEVHDFSHDRSLTTRGAADITVGDQVVRFDLTTFSGAATR